MCVSSCRHPKDFPSAGHSLCLSVFNLFRSLSARLSLHSSSPPSPPVLHIPLFSSTCLSSFEGFLSLNHISISFHLSPPTHLLPSCSLLPSDCPGLLSTGELPHSAQAERECLQLELVWLLPLTLSTPRAPSYCPPQLKAPHAVQIPLCPPSPTFLLIWLPHTLECLNIKMMAVRQIGRGCKYWTGSVVGLGLSRVYSVQYKTMGHYVWRDSI